MWISKGNENILPPGQLKFHIQVNMKNAGRYIKTLSV